MTRHDWWLGIGAIVLTLLVHAIIPQYLPRYDWRHQGNVLWLRVDRWTGAVESVRLGPGITYPEKSTSNPTGQFRLEDVRPTQ